MKKYLFRISVVALVAILVVVSFYMLNIHVPYYNYYHGLDEVRNEICEKNNYEYMDYFYEYHGKETYYTIKVKINGIESIVAYNEKKELVDTYQGTIFDEESVKKAIANKYKDEHIQIDHLDIAYENNQFVYYGKYQNNSTLCYVYYRLDNGQFMKTVKLGE